MTTDYPVGMLRTLPGHVLGVLGELEYTDDPGLRTVADGRQVSGPRDYFWRDLRDKVGVDAAFFFDGVPLVAFTGDGGGDGLASVRSRLWNYGRVPLLLACSANGQVSVFNATWNPHDRRDSMSGLLAETTGERGLATEILRAFSRKYVESGYFGEQYARHYDRAKRVDQGLLANLRYLRSNLPDATDERVLAINDLIGGSLIAVYLEHRGVLNREHLQQLAGVDSLQDALLGGRSVTLRLFVGLAQRFNGDVFGGLPNILQYITNQDLERAAALLRGDDLASGQQSLWPYDFAIVPADLVSNVYEQLLEGDRRVHGTYYTPRFLVDLILDELLPLDGSSMPDVIDLACGSGAFITEAFRRLVYRLPARPEGHDFSTLSSLLGEHIYGVDINHDAARVTAFGLYLTLLEHVDPPTIWESAVLPQLIGKNIVVGDAFSDHALTKQKFDIVVSNPPWVSRLTPAAVSYLEERRSPVGDRQLAQAFLWLATDMLHPGGRLGLVMPAKGMLHNRSSTNLAFRAQVLQELEVKTIVDLSALRRGLFATAIAPTAIVIADKPNRTRPLTDSQYTEDILHLAAHPRPLNAAMDALVVTPEELRRVPKSQALNQPEIWKVLLWGSIRDLKLLNRLKASHPSLGSLIERNDWYMGQGYKEGGDPQSDASDMIGLPLIKPSAVKTLRVDPLPTEVFTRGSLHRTRSMRTYLGPKILISRTLPGGRLSAAMHLGDAVFSSNITSIAGKMRDLPLLYAVTAAMVSSLGQYWQFMTSASWGVERETVEVNELKDMPIVVPDEPQSEILAKIIESASQQFSDEILAKLDEAVFDLFKLSSAERSRVRQGVEYGLKRFLGRRDYPRWADDSRLAEYQQALVGRLQATFPELIIQPLRRRQDPYVLVAVSFETRTWKDSSNSERQLDIEDFYRRLTPRAETTAVVALPGGFFFSDNTVFVVKTSDSDRWSLDSALDDADRILSELAFGRQNAR